MNVKNDHELYDSANKFLNLASLASELGNLVTNYGLATLKCGIEDLNIFGD